MLARAGGCHEEEVCLHNRATVGTCVVRSGNSHFELYSAVRTFSYMGSRKERRRGKGTRKEDNAIWEGFATVITAGRVTRDRGTLG